MKLMLIVRYDRYCYYYVLCINNYINRNTVDCNHNLDLYSIQKQIRMNAGLFMNKMDIFGLE